MKKIVIIIALIFSSILIYAQQDYSWLKNGLKIRYYLHEYSTNYEFIVELTDIQKAKQYKVPTKYPDGEPMSRQAVMRKISEKELDINSIKQLNDVHMDVLYRLVRDKEIKRDDIKNWIGTLEGGKEKRRLLERLREKYPSKLEE